MIWHSCKGFVEQSTRLGSVYEWNLSVREALRYMQTCSSVEAWLDLTIKSDR